MVTHGDLNSAIRSINQGSWLRSREKYRELAQSIKGPPEVSCVRQSIKSSSKVSRARPKYREHVQDY